MSNKSITSQQVEWLRVIHVFGDTDGVSKRQLNTLIKRGWIELFNADKPEHMQYYDVTPEGFQAVKVYYIQKIISNYMPASNDLRELATNLALAIVSCDHEYSWIYDK